ncbi:MAG: polyribonucleotide nucleotidyltransferase [Patescibacteria group bacterium]
MTNKKFTTEVGGKTLTAEFNDIAQHANGSCMVTYGGTVVFATAVMSAQEREGIDFFPLLVDYEEKFYAARRILGSRFVRREGRASDEAILVARLIDRGIRPLFSQKIRNDVQVVVMVLSVDEENDPDFPAIVGASLALGTSNIPWNGPIGATRVGKVDGNFVSNPAYEEMAKSHLDIMVCGKDGKINMIEAGAAQISEDEMSDVLEFAIKEIDTVCEFQNKIIKEIGKEKARLETKEIPQNAKKDFEARVLPQLEEAIYVREKMNRYEKLNEIKKEWMDYAKENFPDVPKNLHDSLFEESVNDIVHKNIIEKEKRPDGRGIAELRPLFAKVKILSRTHGSGLFYRGETHILSVVTLGAPSDAQLIEGMEVRTKKRFMHHYNFPGFSVGEVKAMRGPGRRDIGHGALAERALREVIPDSDKFPYTIRVVSETLSSNGSSSMGSVCASVLALMDAGVPIKAPAAGIAMGLMMASPSSTSDVKSQKTSDVLPGEALPKYKILTDIQGPEDHHGDMDFKVAGTKKGITAVQMDVKVDGIPLNILFEAFAQAREARLEILDVITKELSGPREELSQYAPRIISMIIDKDKIRDVIGPGGKMINSIIEETGSQIDVEQTGEIFITGPNEEAAKRAYDKIRALTKEIEIGETFTGRVTRIFPFGAMVEFAPGQEGMVHISELAPFRVNQVTDVVSPGDEVNVKVINKDDQGRVNLSIKAVQKLDLKSEEDRKAGEAEASKQQEARERRDRGRGGFRGRR